jgi:hypothetical protein
MTLEEFQKRIAALPETKLESMLARCRQEGPAEALSLLVAEQIRRRAQLAGATIEASRSQAADPQKSDSSQISLTSSGESTSEEIMAPTPPKAREGKSSTSKSGTDQNVDSKFDSNLDSNLLSPSHSHRKPSESQPHKSGYPLVIPQPEGLWGMAFKGAFAAVFTLGALRILLRLMRR